MSKFKWKPQTEAFVRLNKNKLQSDVELHLDIPYTKLYIT